MSYAGGVRPPQRPGEVPELRGGSADHAAALLGTIATLAGLQERNQTGKGSLVTTSVFQGAMHMNAATRLLAERETTPPDGSGAGKPGCVAPFQTEDGKWVFISAWNDRQFKRLCHTAKLPHLAEDPEYASRQQRGIHRDELNEVFGQWVATKKLA